ncbi:MAG: ATP-binding protein [Holophaga sp.]|nr:ATP-binding protein [Holophaga sp.]
MDRPTYLRQITHQFKVHHVLALLGPRQCGKTTLARQFAGSLKAGAHVHLFDLEDPTHLARLENPKLALEHLSGLVIIDEVQRRPDLFPVLRVLVDRPGNRTRFLILGSASRDLIRQGAESLAGRIGFLELPPFSLQEVESWRRLWLRGGFPRAYLARTDQASATWLKAYVSTFLERDIPALGIQIPAQALRRFWMMLAHYHGQLFNSSELGRSLGISDTTVRRYLDLLTGTFMVRQLLPWTENLGKRLVKTPKIYFRDSGVFHSLLGLELGRDIETHPKLGASWEGFALESALRVLDVPSEEAYFWATHNQAELDLLVFRGGKRFGFEFKYTDAPRTTKSMASAMENLGLERLYVVFPGDQRFPLSERVEALGLTALKNLTLPHGPASLP